MNTNEVIYTALGSITTIATGWFAFKGKLAELKASVGTPNGQGNLTQMMERQNAKLNDIDVRLVRVEDHLTNPDRRNQ